MHSILGKGPISQADILKLQIAGKLPSIFPRVALRLSPRTGVAFNKLGPTLLNTEGYGQPVSGGFNYHDRRQALGDAWGWVDHGRVTTNLRFANTDRDLGALNTGAAYVPW